MPRQHQIARYGLCRHRKLPQEEAHTRKVLTGDGYKGWPEHLPFDAIIVTCAPEDVPQTIVDQLKEGGRMILPVGETDNQRLVIVRKQDGAVRTQADLPVRFVPMVCEKPGRLGERPKDDK